MDYIRQIVIKHHKLLNSIDNKERQRMAIIGDGIWKGIAAACVATRDISTVGMHELMNELNKNELMASFFPKEFIGKQWVANEHVQATFFEAAIYLEYNQYGFNYIQERVHEGLIF